MIASHSEPLRRGAPQCDKPLRPRRILGVRAAQCAKTAHGRVDRVENGARVDPCATSIHALFHNHRESVELCARSAKSALCLPRCTTTATPGSNS